MATQVQNRRGSTAEHSTFTGAVGEVTIDTDKDTAVVHDGSTAGGRPLLREDLSNLPAGTIDNADINASAAIAGTKISPNFGSQNVTTTGTSTAASFIPTSSSAPTNGLYLSAANSVALSTDGTGRLFIDSSGNVGVNAAAPAGRLGVDGSVVIGNQLSTGTTTGTLRAVQSTSSIYLQTGLNTTTGSSADLVFSNINASNEWMRLTSGGRLGIGTSSVSAKLHVKESATDTYGVIRVEGNNRGGEVNFYNGTALQSAIWGNANTLNFATGAAYTQAMIIDSSQRVGIGTTPDSILHVLGPGGIAGLRVGYNNTSVNYYDADTQIFRAANATERARIRSDGMFEVKGAGTAGASPAFSVNGSAPANSAQLDSSGRLLVGTASSASIGASLQVRNDSGLNAEFFRASADGGAPYFVLSKSRGSAGSPAVVASEDNLGYFSFRGYDGSAYIEGASIRGTVDGTPGVNDLPSRLVFSTTSDGQASPTPRLTIDKDGVATFTKAGAIGISIGGGNPETIFRNQSGMAGIHFSLASIIPTDGGGNVTDNTRSLGTGQYRWSVVYAGTGTINTSDASLKQDVEDLEQTELNVATAIKGLIKKFRFIDAVANKGDGARIHVGVIAQEVEQAFVGEGLDPRRYAMFCEDTLEDGSKRLGIRYDELLAFVIAAL